MHFKSLNLTFIDVPKCACSTIKKILIKNEFNLSNEDKVLVGHPNWSKKYSDLAVESENNDSIVFAIVRNPYVRLRSAYVNIYLDRGKNDQSFREFILNLPELMKKDLSDYPNNHFRPCSHFIDVENVKIFNLEKMDDVFSFLEKKGVKKEFLIKEKVNSSNYKKLKPFYFDTEMLVTINEVYKKDFEIGNYNTERDSFTL
jgi:hypothetical protein